MGYNFVREVVMKIRSTIRLAALALLPLLADLPAAHAATVTTTFQVTASVVATCSATATTLAFGAYDATAAIDQANTMSVTCTNGTAYTVALDNGLYASGSQRRMKDAGTDYLNYNLYSDAGRTTAWDSTNTVSDTGDGAAQSHPVYGRLPAGQTLFVGSYADTVTVTVTF